MAYTPSISLESFPAFPHKPNPSAPYILWTEEADEIASFLPKAACAVWQHLLRSRPGGVKATIEIKSLVEVGLGCGNRRGKGYSVQTIRNALKTLEELNLLQVVRRYYGGVMEVIVRHAGNIIPLDQKGARTLSKKNGEPAKKFESSQKNLQGCKKVLNSEPESLANQGFSSLHSITDQIDLSDPEAELERERFSNPIQDPEKEQREDWGVEYSAKNEATTNPEDNAEGNSSAPPAPTAKKPTMAGFKIFFELYCGLKDTGDKGDPVLAEKAYLALEGWSDAEILEIFESDLRLRKNAAARSPNQFFESFPYAFRYLRSENLRARQQALSAAQPTPKSSSTPAIAPSAEQYCQQLVEAGVIQPCDPANLPVVSGAISAHAYAKWNVPDSPTLLLSLAELRQMYPPEALWDLAFVRGFCRQYLRGIEGDRQDDCDLGLAGLRDFWKEITGSGNSALEQALQAWISSRPELALTADGPDLEF